MENLKKGDVLVNDGVEFTVLTVVGEIVFIRGESWNSSCTFFAKDELTKEGFTIKDKPWEPKYGKRYYFINDMGNITGTIWSGDNFDNSIKNFLGIFPTREQAEQRLKEIKEKFGD